MPSNIRTATLSALILLTLKIPGYAGDATIDKVLQIWSWNDKSQGTELNASTIDAIVQSNVIATTRSQNPDYNQIASSIGANPPAIEPTDETDPNDKEWSTVIDDSSLAIANAQISADDGRGEITGSLSLLPRHKLDGSGLGTAQSAQNLSNYSAPSISFPNGALAYISDNGVFHAK